MDPKVLREAELRLLACRFLYYVVGESPLPDQWYDAVEKQVLPYLHPAHMLHKPGSSNPEDYGPTVRQWAAWLVKPVGPPPEIKDASIKSGS